MDHPTDSMVAAITSAATLVVALALLMAPGAALAGPATDEYKLDLPEVQQAGLENIAVDDARGEPAGPLGVVAESTPAEDPLEATGSLLGAAPLLVVALLGVGLVWAGAMVARKREART